MSNNILMGAFNNEFLMGDGNWEIHFNKQSQEVFALLKNHIHEEIWILTGPGSFIGTRSVLSFVNGFTFNTTTQIKGFNILMDIIPHMIPLIHMPTNKNILYFFQEVERFYYCIYDEDLKKRNYFLISKEELILLKHEKELFIIGNDAMANLQIDLNFKNLYSTISNLVKHGKNYNFEALEYCGKFVI